MDNTALPAVDTTTEGTMPRILRTALRAAVESAEVVFAAALAALLLALAAEVMAWMGVLR